METQRPQLGLATERAALFRLSPAVVAEAIGLPEGAYIDSVAVSQEVPGEVILRIRGAGYPVEVGRAIPYVYPIVTVHRNPEGEVTKRTVEWGFPKD